MSPIGFTAKRRNGGESFSDTSLKSESDVAQGNVQGRFNSNSLCTSFDDGASSCWKSNDDGGSRGEGLVVVDGREEWEDGREIRWVDSNVLMGVVVSVQTEVVPRFWEHRGDGRELKGWGEDVSRPYS